LSVLPGRTVPCIVFGFPAGVAAGGGVVGAAEAEAAVVVVVPSSTEGVAAHQIAAVRKRTAPTAGSHIGVFGSGRGSS
jgi:hypothetical protein